MFTGYSVQSKLRLISVLALFVLSLGVSIDAFAQSNTPQPPSLSLTGGTNDGYDDSYYPDGRIWVARQGANGKREILVPVFIKNCWVNTPTYQAFPIYSFQFKLQYDSSALKAVGVQTFGPKYSGTHPNVRLVGDSIAGLASGWNLDWNVAVDSSYKVQTGLIPANNQDRLYGHRLRVTGESARPLAPTGDASQLPIDCNSWAFEPLVWVRFEVLAGIGSRPQADNQPVIITNDSIRYNAIDVKNAQFFPNPAYPPTPGAGLAGMDNSTKLILNNVEPTRPGMIYVRVTDLPRIGFTPTDTTNPNATAVVPVVDGQNNLFELKRMIAIDRNAQKQQIPASREITLGIDALTNGTRLQNITVESDQEWLTFQSVARGTQTKSPFPSATRRGTIAYIDRGILGGLLSTTDPLEQSRPQNPDPLMIFQINCDPNAITEDKNPETPETDGIYVGYITIKSSVAEVTPVRLKVTFLVVRSPEEKYSQDKGIPAPADMFERGIVLNVRNSAPIPSSADLMFGSGYRATNGADSLYGEFRQDLDPPSSFYARFYPMDTTLAPFGFGDFTGVYASKDIRSNDYNPYTNKGDSTYVYKVKFSAGSPSFYPVTISWDVESFPPGSALYLRDVVNGGLFNVDMRNATPLGGSRYGFTIRDARINEFVIEYTPARTSIKTDMKKGWNLVSLPVRPSNPNYKASFKGSINTPFRFTLNQYQSEENLSVGTGYFVKYPVDSTETFSGAIVKEINPNNYLTELFEGWNTIGSLSVPTSIENVSFDAVNRVGAQRPRRSSNIYGYNTDRGYREVSEIKPGLGYWVKVDRDGYLRMTSPTQKAVAGESNKSELASSTNVTVRDAAGRENNMFIVNENASVVNYELPPAPASSLFDVRFANGAYVENAKNPVVRFQGVDFPVAISVANANANYNVVDAVSGEVLGTINGSGKVVITNSEINAVRLLNNDKPVSEFNVTASPNPTSGRSTINYSLPTSQTVNVAVFNALGQQVATLDNGVRGAGEYTVEFDGSVLPNGQYLVKVVAGNVVTVKTVTVSK